MHAVHFSKPFVERALAAIREGEPIPCPDGGWTGKAMLTLAGVLYAAVYSQGPHTRQVLGPAAEKIPMHPEHKEAADEALAKDVHCAIEFLSGLTFEVIDGAYDGAHGPELTAIVWRDGSRPCVLGVKGFKRAGDA